MTIDNRKRIRELEKKIRQLNVKIVRKDWTPCIRGYFCDSILDYQKEYKELTGHYYVAKNRQ